MSVVLPVRDPAGLPLLLRGLPPVDEVVVVAEAGSAAAVAARSLRPGAVVVSPTRPGPGNALASGIAAARGDVVVTLNGDGSTDPAEIPRFVAALVAGADVVTGSRYVAGGRDLTGGRFRRWADLILIWCLNVLLGTRRTDPGFGYTALWRDAVDQLNLPDPSMRAGASWGEGPEIAPLLTIRPATRGLGVTEVPSVAFPPIRRTHRDDRPRLHHWLRTALRERANRRSHGRPSSDTSSFVTALRATSPSQPNTSSATTSSLPAAPLSPTKPSAAFPTATSFPTAASNVPRVQYGPGFRLEQDGPGYRITPEPRSTDRSRRRPNRESRIHEGREGGRGLMGRKGSASGGGAAGPRGWTSGGNAAGPRGLASGGSTGGPRGSASGSTGGYQGSASGGGSEGGRGLAGGEGLAGHESGGGTASGRGLTGGPGPAGGPGLAGGRERTTAAVWRQADRRATGEPIWSPSHRASPPVRDLWRGQNPPVAPYPASHPEPLFGPDVQPRAAEDAWLPLPRAPKQPGEVGARRRRIAGRQSQPDLRVINGEGAGPAGGRRGRLRSVKKP
ncbi:glycosyltransferase family 2 protein [Actinoplanes sp. CA-131856]